MSEGIDFGPLVRSINNLSEYVQVVDARVAAVDDRVAEVALEQRATHDRLQHLHAAFNEFVAADRRDKARQFAQTRLVEIRQEMEKRFGHYDEVRRTAPGLLQATDVGIVREETMRVLTETLMLKTPRYWLTPALVALAGWIGDKRALAERALAEAVTRDDSKASLFFALVCRRARRMPATVRWLKRYFQLQHPTAIDREVVLMLDALANGVFGGAALLECSGVIETWMTELEQQAGFVDEQRQRWAERLAAMTPRVAAREYPTLRQNSPTWPALEASLAAARRSRACLAFFEHFFSGEIPVPPSLEVAVDERLDALVTNFDDEELPLKRDEREQQLIVAEQGDVDAARRRLAAEAQGLEERTSFAAMLTSAAMTPEHFGATRATQRYAVSRSRTWIAAAQADLLARERAAQPLEIELRCGSWQGRTRDGADEPALVQDLHSHYRSRTEQADQLIKLSPGVWIALVVGGLLGVALLPESPLAGLVIAGGAAAFFFWQRNVCAMRRKQARETLDSEREQAKGVLKACLAEVVDLRREIAGEERHAESLATFLEGLSAPQFVVQRPEQARAVAV